MSSSEFKVKHSRRRQKDENAIAKQLKIAKRAYYIGDPNDTPYIKQPHRLVKHHAMNCGNPDCVMCGNPRKTFQELTIQERKFYQEVDKENTRHSNGLNNNSDDDKTEQ